MALVAPTISPTTVAAAVQSTTGLVITPGTLDTGDSYQISFVNNDANGPVTLSDGTTQVEDNSTITRAQGAAGLTLTPDGVVHGGDLVTTLICFQAKSFLASVGVGVLSDPTNALALVKYNAPVWDSTNTPTKTDTATVGVPKLTGIWDFNIVDSIDPPSFWKFTFNNCTCTRGGSPIASGSYYMADETQVLYTPTGGTITFTVQASQDNAGTALSAVATSTITVSAAPVSHGRFARFSNRLRRFVRF